MNSVTQQPISIGQRLTGLGILCIGLFALVNGLMYVQTLWDTPSRNLGVGVIVGSALMTFGGVAFGFPELLPKKVVALSILLFGLFSLLMGVAILLWFLYNTFVERQPEFQAGRLGIVFAMIWVRLGMMYKGYSKLSNRD